MKKQETLKEIQNAKEAAKRELAGEMRKTNEAMKAFVENIPKLKEELEKVRTERGVGAERKAAKSSEAKKKVKAKSKLDAELEEIQAKLAALG